MAMKDWKKIREDEYRINYYNKKNGDNLWLDKNTHYSDKLEWDVMLIKKVRGLLRGLVEELRMNLLH